jgi:hypothetical protein
MKNVRVTLALGIALIIAVGVLVLKQSPPRVLRSNGPSANWSLAGTSSQPAFCQAKEVLPATTSAIRLSITGFFGSNVHVVAYRGARVLTEGSRGPDWTGTSVTVPVKRVNHTSSQVNLCFALGPNEETIVIPGFLTSPRDAAVASESGGLAAAARGSNVLTLKGRVLIEYLAVGQRSWWSRISSVVRNMGLGHFIGGIWVALLAGSLMLALGFFTVRLTLRERP